MTMTANMSQNSKVLLESKFDMKNPVDSGLSKILGGFDRVNKYDYSKMIEEFKFEERIENKKKTEVSTNF